MGFVCLAAFDLVENFHLGMETHREILKTKRWGGGAGLGNVESALMSEKEIYTRMGEKLTEKQRRRATDPETRGGS